MHILTFSLQEDYDEITCHPNFLIRGRNAMMLPFKWTSSAKRLRSTTCISFLGFHQKNLNFLLELLTTHKSERVNVIPSYKPRLQASTIWPWMVWISGQILSTYFFTSWTEHVHTTEKIHKIKAQLQTQFCLAILKLNIDLSTVGEKKILTYVRVLTISQKIIDRGWGGVGGGGFFQTFQPTLKGLHYHGCSYCQLCFPQALRNLTLTESLQTAHLSLP